MTERRIGLVAQGGKGWFGGAQYIANLATALSELSVETVLIAAGGTDTGFWNSMRLPPDTRRRTGRELGRPTRALRSAIHRATHVDAELVALLVRERVRFAYPFFGGRVSRALPFRHAAWIPDLQHVHLPQHFSDAEREARSALFARVARHATTVVLSSKTVEHDLLENYPAAAGKTRVLRFRSIPSDDALNRDVTRVRKIHGVPDDFFLVSNQFWRHKNHDVVFRALAMLDPTPFVVCTGRLSDYRDPDFFAETVRTQLEELGIAERVKLLGLIPRDDQLTLMRACRAVIQPSLFEGWSTVVEDARALGTPIIASSIDTHVEQTADFEDSVLFRPHDAHQLAEILRTYEGNADAARTERARPAHRERVLAFGRDFLDLTRC